MKTLKQIFGNALHSPPMQLLRGAIRGVETPAELRRLLRVRGKNRVLGGPFRGMRYINTSSGSAYPPKLLGTYEMELAPYFTEERLAKFNAIFNIGCGEGYYVAGMSVLLKNDLRSIRMVGYDINPVAIKNARKLIRLNQIGGVELRSDGFYEDLEATSAPAFVLCDIEGGELELLDPIRCGALAGTTILVEVHDGREGTGIQNELLKRFTPSHTSTTIEARARTVADFPCIRWPRCPDRVKMNLMAEHRSKGLKWLLLEPRGHAVLRNG